VTEPSHAWLEQLIRACEGAAARLERRNDPALEPLLDDIRALHARLQQKLDALDPCAAR
jgi:type VI protein secretion system component VasA